MVQLLPAFASFALPLALSLFARPQPPVRTPSTYDVLAAEYARAPESRVIDAAAASGDSLLQRLAARAYGRIERRESVPRLVPLLTAPAASVRREAANAMAQMRAPMDYPTLLAAERDATVRGAIFEAIGRTAPEPNATPNSPPPDALVGTLVRGLSEAQPAARLGAARGLESLIRRTGRTARPAASTTASLREALRGSFTAGTAAAMTPSEQSELRQLLLLALTAAGDRDSVTFAPALTDTSAQVRRLAVAASRQWVDDPAPMVRYQALRVAGTCERATAALRDSSDHVLLTAVDLLGERRCPTSLIDSLVRRGGTWRVQAHALVALARVDTARARAALSVLSGSRVWQARAWAANAAKMVRDSVTLAQLARDTAPNVAIAALSTTDDALRALQSRHAGLVLAGATHLKGNARLSELGPQLATSLLRLSARREVTLRDPRIALLQRLLESADSATAMRLLPLLRDPDPEVAALAARVLTDRAHRPSQPVTTRYVPPAFPTAAALRALQGARAVLRVRGLGEIEIDLLPDDAPATVATFVQLAERRAFDGLTWHRIVPNFVLQGGSPGADEYDGLTTTFMRDEVGFARHARGTFGISTRGRDTGDGQIFINLVDNFRLDHDYTVFGTMRRGWAVMDRVQEGDVIESIRIVRRVP
jgi:cyclophilin family peptidyl-prolyl cis-trans isomerase/HEAT repeat protein